jgi:hypothetical protein
MGKAELKQKGITGCRLRLALALLHAVHDVIYLSVTMIFAATTLLYLLFEDLNAPKDQVSDSGFTLSVKLAKRLETFVTVLRWAEFACLSFYLFDGALHIVSYGWIFLKQWDTVIELVASLTAAVILVYNGVKAQQLRPAGIVRVLIIGVIFRKLSELHLRRNPRR